MATNKEIMDSLSSLHSKVDGIDGRLHKLEGRHDAEDKVSSANRDWTSIVISGVALIIAFGKSIANMLI